MVAKGINNKKHIFIKGNCVGLWYYPRFDIFSINGEPWLHSIYVDTIIADVEQFVQPGEPLGDRNSEAWAMFMVPRANGAAKVWYKDKDRYARSVIDPERTYVDLISKHNPLNNGKPYDFRQWQCPKGGDIKKEQPVELSCCDPPVSEEKPLDPIDELASDDVLKSRGHQ